MTEITLCEQNTDTDCNRFAVVFAIYAPVPVVTCQLPQPQALCCFRRDSPLRGVVLGQLMRVDKASNYTFSCLSGEVVHFSAETGSTKADVTESLNAFPDVLFRVCV